MQSNTGEIGWVPIEVEVHDERGIDADSLHDRLEGRLPVKPVLFRLHCVGQMPVRLKSDEPIEVHKTIFMREGQHVLQGCAGLFWLRQQKQAHLLGRTGGRIHPGIDLRVVVGILMDSHAHPSTPGAVPEIALVGGVVARHEIAMGRGKDSNASSAHAHGHGTVACGQRVPVRSVGRRDLPEAPVRIVVSEMRGHVASGRYVLWRGHLESGVVVVGRVRLAGAYDGRLLDQRSSGIEGVPQRSAEDAHLQAVEGEFDAIAHGLCGYGGGLKVRQKLPCSGGVPGRKIEKHVPAAGPLSRHAAKVGLCGFHDDFAVAGDGRDERRSRIEREARLPIAMG